MSDPDKRSDIEKLLAEAEGVLGGASSPAVAGRGAVQPTKGELSKTLSVALVAAGLAAAIVFVAFTFLPFFGAPSGAVGAFVSTYITAVVLRRR